MNEELDDTYKVVFRQCYPKLLFYATRLVGTEEAEDVVLDLLLILEIVIKILLYFKRLLLPFLVVVCIMKKYNVIAILC